MINDTFYPTPNDLIVKMVGKISKRPDKILEPSAGKGDIVEYIQSRNYNWRRADISTIEHDQDLRATLRGKGINVIDTDFLTYSGPDKFDLIIANPPFDTGDQHLLKALEIMYRGQIIFLLNAETLRNPYSQTRKLLLQKLEEHGAEVEYIQKAFTAAERPTGVEVALINIKIDRKVEDDLFEGCDDTAEEARPEYENKYELSTGKDVADLVAEYNETINIGTETIIGYFKNYHKIYRYIGLNQEADDTSRHSNEDLTKQMQDHVNDLLSRARKDYWRRVLDLREVKSRLTEKKQDEFEQLMNQRQHMDFTEDNIRQFVLNVINGYEKTITDSILDVFDKFTLRHAFSGNVREKNIHYFTGWKTNDAFKVGKKVIIPLHGFASGEAFRSWGSQWRLDMRAARELRDIDLVMNYCDGMKSYTSMVDAIEQAFEQGQSSKILSTYFQITCHKKGTAHFTFRDMDLLRRFNTIACIGKGWLPEGYGKTEYSQLTHKEKEVVESFEGQKSYKQNQGKSLISGADKLLQITAK